MLRVATIAIVLWAGLFVVTATEAQTGVAEAIGPQQLVQQTTEKVLDILANRRAELEQDHNLIYSLTNQIVVPHFDFISISKYVLGKNWRRANKQQKLRFIRAFRKMMVRTYATAVLEYDNNKISYLPLRAEPDTSDVTVRTEYYMKNKPPVSINYSLHQRSNAWKVYDVSVDGVSIVSTYRTSFATEIRQSGLDALIERIEQKTMKGDATEGAS